jgi:hypothetical protein
VLVKPREAPSQPELDFAFPIIEEWIEQEAQAMEKETLETIQARQQQQ